MKNYYFKSFLRSWKHGFGVQFATLCVLAGTYTVTTLALLGHLNMKNILGLWGENIQISAYISDEAQEDQVSKVRTFLNKQSDLDEIKYVSKDEAAKNFLAQMSDHASGLLAEFETGNPLPRSFELSLKKNNDKNLEMNKIKSLAKQIESLAGIDEVSYGQGWVENYAKVINGFATASFFTIIVLLIGGLFVVGNAIRNSVGQRREEIEILELFGAKPSFIKAPFIIEGAFLGFGASLLALIFCFGIYQWQSGVFFENLGFLGLNKAISYLSVSSAFYIVILGTLIGAFGSFVCVRKINTGWAAAQNIES